MTKICYLNFPGTKKMRMMLKNVIFIENTVIITLSNGIDGTDSIAVFPLIHKFIFLITSENPLIRTNPVLNKAQC